MIGPYGVNLKYVNLVKLTFISNDSDMMIYDTFNFIMHSIKLGDRRND